MKRKFALMLAAALAMSASVYAATNLEEAELDNGFKVEYNTETKDIHAKGYASKSSDTAVSSTTKFIDLVIPDKMGSTTITGISAKGFVDYDEFRSITLPSGLETIGDRAFWGCDSFSKITLPDGVTSIGASAFESCDSLAGISFNKKLEAIGAQAFKNCKAVKAFNLPDSVKTIGAGAFEGCKALDTIKLGKGLETLEDGAFKNCTSLKSITIPEGITKLESNTFTGCSALETVILPDGLKVIDNAVFDGCTSLKKVQIPATCKTISKTAFDGAENVVIYCKNGTYAQEYARTRRLPVVTGQEVVNEDTIPENISVFVNGDQIVFKNTQPVIVDGRTLVPMREIFEALGLVVGWDGETKTVTGRKGITDISLTIGQQKIYVNGKEQKIDVPAQIINGSTMVPLRAIGNSVGCNVSWDQNTRTVNISD